MLKVLLIFSNVHKMQARLSGFNLMVSKPLPKVFMMLPRLPSLLLKPLRTPVTERRRKLSEPRSLGHTS
jgi:hypothetical protein